MQIISGEFKGKRLIAPKGIRPVSMRVKKSCFDILRGEIGGKRVLDLFAGSGSLGLEALSLGAREAVFVDLSRGASAAIKKNISSLKVSGQTKVKIVNSLDIIRDFSLYRQEFDIIFIDPPYYQSLLRKALQILGEYDILAPSGYMVAFCYLKDEYLEESGNFSLILKKQYGQNIVLIYSKQETPQ